jgi:catechol 2,3-dioxygenase-like lactoylglutathione lyase family enzyme
MKHRKTSIGIASGLGLLLFALALTTPTSSFSFQQTTRPSDVLGLAFVGHHVSDLERSIKFFEAIDFKVAEGPSAWAVDRELNRLGNTPGAESRTATMKVQSSVSDVPFTLVLRQYRGVQRQDLGKGDTWDLLAAHIDLTVDGSVSALLDKLEAQNLLKMPQINGLQNPRQQQGFRRYAFISDPDGFTLEYFGKAAPQPGAPPPAPTVSNSSATSANMERLGKQAGFNHYATTIVDPQKAQDFYAKVLGGDYPPLEDLNREQVVLHGWFPQATTNNNLRVELLAFTLNKGKTPPPLKFQDINANHTGFQVRNIETAYARARANGAITVSEGGIIDFNKGKAVLIRDSDAGAYIMLWQPPR